MEEDGGCNVASLGCDDETQMDEDRNVRCCAKFNSCILSFVSLRCRQIPHAKPHKQQRMQVKAMTAQINKSMLSKRSRISSHDAVILVIRFQLFLKGAESVGKKRIKMLNVFNVLNFTKIDTRLVNLRLSAPTQRNLQQQRNGTN
eukprot:553263_1